MKAFHGGDIYNNQVIYDYSANINPLGMPPKVMLAAQNAVADALHYPDIHCSLLRKALEEAEGVPRDRILCGNGSAELFFLICGVHKPKRALLAVPSFGEYERALHSAGCRIIYYNLLEEKNFCLQEDFLEYLTGDLDMVILCNPNNPTGQRIDPVMLKKIVKTCREQRILLVLDECFLDFMEEAETYTMKEALPGKEGLIIIKAFTKLYAMPGLRLGYGLFGSSGSVRQMEEAAVPWRVSVPAQAAGIAALGETAFVERSRIIIKEQRELLQFHLKQELAEKVYEGSANFIFFRAKEGLWERFMEKKVLIRDCSNYRGLTKGYYRIAVRTREENAEFLRIWKEMGREG